MEKVGILALALGLCLPFSPAVAFEQYQCAVEDFHTFSDDPEFEEKNRQKKFLVTVTDSEVLVTTTSADFEDTKDTFKIVGATILELLAVEVEVGGFLVLVMPSRPLLTKDYFNMSMSVPGTFFQNTWILRCTA